MQASEFYTKLKSLQQLFPEIPRGQEPYPNGYYQYWGLNFEPKTTMVSLQNEAFNFIENYKIPFYTDHIFYGIYFINEVFYEYEFATFAKFEVDYICLNKETQQVIYAEFCDYHEMGLCATSPEKFLDVMYLLAERATMRVLDRELDIEDNDFLEKVIDVSGDAGTRPFYRYILHMLES